MSVVLAIVLIKFESDSQALSIQLYFDLMWESFKQVAIDV